MKFSIQASRLVSHLQAVMGATASGGTMPVLTCVLISAEAGRLTLTGTDTHLQLTATRAEDIEEPGALCVPAKKLLDICKALPAASTVQLEEKAGKLEVRALRSRFSLAMLPASDFPAAEESSTVTAIEITQPQLQRLLKKTSHAMAVKDIRYYMLGVCLDLQDGRLNAVATDGHRMAVCSMPAGNGQQQCIVPRRAASVLEGLLTNAEDPITLRLGTTQLAVDLPFGEDGTLQFSSRLIDGKFPDYSRIIPRNNSRKLTVHREDLALACARMGLLGGEHGRLLLTLTPNYLSLKSWNEHQEEATDGVDAEYAGTDMEIAFNFSYLLDALKTVTAPQAVIELGTGETPIKITDPSDDDTLFVVMPMRI